jgi:hypothetical protein
MANVFISKVNKQTMHIKWITHNSTAMFPIKKPYTEEGFEPRSSVPVHCATPPRRNFVIFVDSYIEYSKRRGMGEKDIYIKQTTSA